jgi:hypothetical protein
MLRTARRSVRFAPVVPDQVGGDHVEVAALAVHPGPPGQQPDEGLGRDLVGGVVVIDQAPAPAGELEADVREQLLDRTGISAADGDLRICWLGDDLCLDAGDHGWFRC